MFLPYEIIGLKRPEITFIWDDDHVSTYTARSLRLACRCAFCIEEMSGRPLLDPERVPENVGANQIELLGQYAISVKWSDGHETSVYSFRDLRNACPCKACQEKKHLE